MPIGKYVYCSLYDVIENFLLRAQIMTDNLLVVDIQDLFNMPIINYDSGLEFQKDKVNEENTVYMAIIKTIDIMYRRLRRIGRNRESYTINEELTKLPNIYMG